LLLVSFSEAWLLKLLISMSDDGVGKLDLKLSCSKGNDDGVGRIVLCKMSSGSFGFWVDVEHREAVFGGPLKGGKSLRVVL
jgi:hypothetical protein